MFIFVTKANLGPNPNRLQMYYIWLCKGFVTNLKILRLLFITKQVAKVIKFKAIPNSPKGCSTLGHFMP